MKKEYIKPEAEMLKFVETEEIMAFVIKPIFCLDLHARLRYRRFWTLSLQGASLASSSSDMVSHGRWGLLGYGGRHLQYRVDIGVKSVSEQIVNMIQRADRSDGAVGGIIATF